LIKQQKKPKLIKITRFSLFWLFETHSRR